MKPEKLKDTLHLLQMSEDMQTRIVKGALEDMEKVRLLRQPRRKHWRIKTAAILVIAFVSVAAATHHQKFDNEIILENMDEFKQVNEKPDRDTSVMIGLSSPNSPTPHSLEEMIEGSRFKSKDWESERTIGGGSLSSDRWSRMEMIDAEGPLRSRKVYSYKGAVKTEYTAENPRMLQEFITGDFQLNIDALNTMYQYIPDGNMLYTIKDKHQKYRGMMFLTMYASDDGHSYFQLSSHHDLSSFNDQSNTYVLKNSYDVLYNYTNPHGVEFVIKIYGDCVWASSITKNSSFDLYGGYMSADEVEKVLDQVTLRTDIP